jgi:acetyl-CoA carboxylase biotin carboxyl carrier protein
MPINSDEIAEILKILDSSEFDEMNLEMGDIKLYVKRSADTGKFSPSIQTEDIDAAQSVNPEPESSEKDDAPVKTNGLETITAPMAGTFYRSAKPGDPPFVNEGTVVTSDTVVCIVEVMKLMNSVTSNLNGEIVEVCVEDGDIIDKGQILFYLKPTE